MALQVGAQGDQGQDPSLGGTQQDWSSLVGRRSYIQTSEVANRRFVQNFGSLCLLLALPPRPGQGKIETHGANPDYRRSMVVARVSFAPHAVDGGPICEHVRPFQVGPDPPRQRDHAPLRGSQIAYPPGVAEGSRGRDQTAALEANLVQLRRRHVTDDHPRGNSGSNIGINKRISYWLSRAGYFGVADLVMARFAHCLLQEGNLKAPMRVCQSMPLSS